MKDGDEIQYHVALGERKGCLSRLPFECNRLVLLDRAVQTNNSFFFSNLQTAGWTVILKLVCDDDVSTISTVLCWASKCKFGSELQTVVWWFKSVHGFAVCHKLRVGKWSSNCCRVTSEPPNWRVTSYPKKSDPHGTSLHQVTTCTLMSSGWWTVIDERREYNTLP